MQDERRLGHHLHIINGVETIGINFADIERYVYARAFFSKHADDLIPKRQPPFEGNTHGAAGGKAQGKGYSIQRFREILDHLGYDCHPDENLPKAQEPRETATPLDDKHGAEVPSETSMVRAMIMPRNMRRVELSMAYPFKNYPFTIVGPITVPAASAAAEQGTTLKEAQ
jgi:hypothetical protein